MKKVILLVAAAVAAATLASALRRNPVAQAREQARGDEPRARTALSITFGEKQERETDYSGTLDVSAGRVTDLIPWRFFGDDKVVGENGWSLVTRRANMEPQPDHPQPIATAGQTPNIVPKGVSVVVEAPPTADVRIQTRRATYAFRFNDLNVGHQLVFEDGDVIVQAVPAPTRVSPAAPPNATEDDYPSLAIAADGSAWVAWQAYQDSGDRVLVAHSTATGWSVAEPLTPAGQDIFHTAIAEDSRGRMWVVWSEREGESWDLVARVRDAANWSARRKLTSGGGGPNFFHKLVRDRKGHLHLVWVAHRDAASHIMWSELEGDRWSTPREISGANAWMPDAASDSKGDLYVAWDSYRSGNYDIFLRRIGADGVLGPIEQVTRSSRFQAHASVAVDQNDRVWLAWDESGSNWGKDYARDDTWRGTPLYADRRPRLAVLENGRWSAPVADPTAAIPSRYRRFVEQPKLACDGAGRMWLSLEVRTSTTMNRTDFWANNGRWDVFVTAYEGDHWRAAAPVPRSSTRPGGAFHIAGGPSGVWAVWANANRPFPAAGAGNRGHHDVEFARMDGESNPPPPALEPFSEPPANAAFIHPHENTDVQRVRAYRIQSAGSELRILRGDFHRHTEMSPDGAGDGSLEDYFRYMLDAAQMDTGIVSDHQEGGEEYTWWRTEKAIDLFHIAGGFTPLFGYERSVPYPNGHRNVVFPQRGVRVLNISREEQSGTLPSGPILYPYLKQNRGVCMLHSLATDQGSDYRDNDPEVEPLVELYQGYHANYEYAGAPRAESSDYNVATHGPYRPAGFYWNGLAKGYKLGVQASSDHISTHSSYTMIYTPSAARRDIVESMRKRHAYGATDNIVLDYRVRDRQGHEWMMGDAFDSAAPPVMHVKVLGTSGIQSVEIVKDGKFIYKTEPHATTVEFDYSDTSPVPGKSWYYVRVIQEDRNMAWSSPVWITYFSTGVP